MKDKIKSVHSHFKQGGIMQVTSEIKDYLTLKYLTKKKDLFSIYSDIRFRYSGVRLKGNYENRRIDLDDRWDFIKSYIQECDSLVDIGCAEGYNTVHAAQEGLFSLGIDHSDDRLKKAKSKINEDNICHCSFMKWDISPDNITDIPPFDVILLLTVHHHWEAEYGLKEAEFMFQVLMDRADIMIYEPPGDRPLIRNEKGRMNPEISKEYYSARLKSLYGSKIEIVNSIMTTHQGGRKDPVFCIDTSDYSINTRC